jgi:hypothetical protein
MKRIHFKLSDDTIQTLEAPFYSISWGIGLIILGVFMWNNLLPTAIGSAFLILGLIALIFDTR